MLLFSLAVAVLSAVAIIGIGLGYLFAPRAMAPSFGLPLPAEGAATGWWLRPKGVRDVVAGCSCWRCSRQAAIASSASCC